MRSTPEFRLVVPEGWNVDHLESLCEGVFDCPHTTPQLTTNGPYVARSQDIRGGTFLNRKSARVSRETYSQRIARAEPRFGDLFFSREGTYFGIAAEVPPDTEVCLGQRMMLLRPALDVINHSFLRYWLNSPIMETYMKGFHDGSVAQRLNVSTIRRFPVAFPGLSEQRQIASILGALDDKIELNREMNGTLEAMARALFKSWFVDFDPVTARAAGRTPAHLAPSTADLFPKTFADSELGPIPEGWEVKSVPDAFEVNPTRRLSKKELAPYLAMQQMPTSSAIPDDWIMREFGSGMKFVNGDTLVARITPCLENGKTAFVNFLEDGQVAWGSTEYIVLRSRDPLPLEFSYLLARDDDFRAFAIANMTGSSGRQRVPADSLSQFLLTVPTKPVAEAFGRMVGPLFHQCLHNASESRDLAATRDALLPELLSGRIRLRDAERIVEEVA